MKLRRIIAIYVRPGALDGARAALHGNQWRGEAVDSIPWAVGDGGGKLFDAIASTDGATVRIALHPAFVLTQKIKVPRARPQAIAQFLELQSGRFCAGIKAEELLWTWRLPNWEVADEDHFATVYIARKSLLQPLLDECDNHGFAVEFAAAETAVLAQLTRIDAEGPASILTRVEGGHAYISARNGFCFSQHWLPATEAGSEGVALRFLLGDEPAAQVVVDRSVDAALKSAVEASGATIRMASTHVKTVGEYVKPKSVSQPLDDLIHADAALLPSFTKAGQSLSARIAPLMEYAQDPPTKRRLTVAAIVLLILFGGSRMLSASLYERARKDAAKMEYDNYAAEKNIGIVETLGRDRKPMLDYLVDLKKCVPDGVILESFKVEAKGSVTITGQTGSYSNAEAMTVKLNTSKSFMTATTQSVNRANDQVKFIIRCKLRRAG
ncbi:hypothetical protein BH09SUM1_BH09SUM1_23390 [soil metagenome]